MNRENPFPGINPWMQNVWPDVHTRLIGYIVDVIEDFLPDDLIVRAKEGVKFEIPIAGPTPRWIEIQTTGEELVTVIEITSPANKTRPGREDFEKKINSLWERNVNTVEIDLVTGPHSARSVRTGFDWPKEPRQIVVNRPPDFSTHEVYPCPLRDRLPAFRVPLRPVEPGLPLDLQPLINQCFRKGRYWTLPYNEAPDCSLEKEDLAWARDLARNEGLCD